MRVTPHANGAGSCIEHCNRKVSCTACRLRSKLQQALALLRTYQHKVRVMDAAMTSMEHQQTQTQPAPMSACQTQTEEPAAPGRCMHAEQPTSATCMLVRSSTYVGVNDNMEALTAAVQEASAAARIAGDCGSAATLQQPCNSEAQTALAQCAAQDTPAGLQKGAESPGHGCCSLGGPTLLAAGQSLRFDPTAGECGAFFIVSQASRPAAASREQGPGPRTPPLQSHSHQSSVGAGAGGCTRADDGSSQGPRMDAAAGRHQASAGMPWQQQPFSSSLLDLVAEVDDIVSQHRGETVPQELPWSSAIESVWRTDYH